MGLRPDISDVSGGILLIHEQVIIVHVDIMKNYHFLLGYGKIIIYPYLYLVQKQVAS